MMTIRRALIPGALGLALGVVGLGQAAQAAPLGRSPQSGMLSLLSAGQSSPSVQPAASPSFTPQNPRPTPPRNPPPTPPGTPPTSGRGPAPPPQPY